MKKMLCIVDFRRDQILIKTLLVFVVFGEMF